MWPKRPADPNNPTPDEIARAWRYLCIGVVLLSSGVYGLLRYIEQVLSGHRR